MLGAALGSVVIFALGLLRVLLFCSYVLYPLTRMEHIKASDYLKFAPQAAASGLSLPFTYSRAQWQVYGWVINSWDMVGKDVLPIVLWAGLTLAQGQTKEGSWGRRLL